MFFMQRLLSHMFPSFMVRTSPLRKTEKNVKLVRISRWSAGDKNAVDLKIVCDWVKHANVVAGLHTEVIARTNTATHKPKSAQRLKMTTVTHTHIHLIIVCGASRLTA